MSSRSSSRSEISVDGSESPPIAGTFIVLIFSKLPGFILMVKQRDRKNK